MMRTAEETYERERPITLLGYITRSATLQSISKPQGTWRIVDRPSHLWKLPPKKDFRHFPETRARLQYSGVNNCVRK